MSETRGILNYMTTTTTPMTDRGSHDATVSNGAHRSAATTANASKVPQGTRCRLVRSRVKKIFSINPSSRCPDFDVKVEVRHQEDCELRPYDHHGLLDSSYFGSANLLLEKTINSPNQFDVFALDRLTELPVHQFGMFLFNRCGFFRFSSGLYLDPLICSWLLQKITSLYHYKNPYHNQLHAIDVTQAFYTMQEQPGIQKRLCLDSLELFTTLLAALCHDIDHPGCTAKYLCLFKHQNFFKMYNDRYCELEDPPKEGVFFTLEDHHTRMGYSLLVQSGLMEFLCLTGRQRSYTTRLMSDLISATNMERHKSLVEKFEADLLLAQAKQCANESNDSETDGDVQSNTGSSYSQMKAMKMDLLELLIKCADIGNPFRHWNICSAWAELVCQEFYNQGDMEELCKKYYMSTEEVQSLPGFTGGMKRTGQIAAVQVGFISFFVLPLIKVYTQVESTDSSKVFQRTVEQNLKMWKLLDNTTEEKVMEFIGPIAEMLPRRQLNQVMETLLKEQKITLTVRSTN